MGTRARLLRVHVAAEAVPESERRPANLVFLIDTSGSMRGAGRLQLVKYALTHLLDRLDPGDSLSVVTYAGQERLLFPPTPVRDKTTIADALLDLGAGGGTNGAGGIRLAYEQAQAAFRPEGINRVILCTDGDFNVGITGEELVRFAEARAAEGIRLTGLGFGDGNYRDDFMEDLTNRADGNYAYIDTPNEALRVLGERLVSTLQVVAEDVKIQVEMDPAVVGRYRLIGFENRLLTNESFEDDAADAGDVGAGHHITAFYELELREGASGAVGEIRLRYQPAGGGASQLIIATPKDGAEPSAAFRAGAAITEWAEILRDSPHAEGRRLGEVRRALEASLGRAPLERELLELVLRSEGL